MKPKMAFIIGNRVVPGTSAGTSGSGSWFRLVPARFREPKKSSGSGSYFWQGGAGSSGSDSNLPHAQKKVPAPGPYLGGSSAEFRLFFAQNREVPALPQSRNQSRRSRNLIQGILCCRSLALCLHRMVIAGARLRSELLCGDFRIT